MTTAPARIQRRRTPGWTTPLDPHGRRAIYVGRNTRWGNPWKITEASNGWTVTWTGSGTNPFDAAAETNQCEVARLMAVGLYRDYLDIQPDLATRARRDLPGRDLMCWCPLPEPGQSDHCHAAVLLELANTPTP